MNTDEFQFAGGDLPGGFVVSLCGVLTSMVAAERAPEYRHCTLLWLGVCAAETEQDFWKVFSGDQGAEMRAHIAQVTGGRCSLVRMQVLMLSPNPEHAHSFT